MEEHCPEPGLPARGDYVIVAQALSQVKSYCTSQLYSSSCIPVSRVRALLRRPATI